MPGIALAQQQPFPTYADSSRWSVALSVMGMPYGTDVVRFTDTLSMCGHQYAVTEELLFGSAGYFRNEGPRTYLRRTTECSDKEYLTYDFSLGIGDTAYVGSHADWNDQDTAIAIVDEIVTLTYQGVERRRFTVLLDRCPMPGDAPLFTHMYWVEGIGSLTHPFYSLICICNVCETGMTLTCADSSNVPLYRSAPDVTCHENVGVHEIARAPGPALVIGQHATNGWLPVMLPKELRTGQLFIFDAAGRARSVQQVTASTRGIDAIGLEAGVFLALLVETDGRRWAARWANMP